MKAINISICSCGKFLDRHSWRPYKDMKEIITKRIREKLAKAKVSFKEFELPKSPKEKIDVPVVAVYKGKEQKPVVLVRNTKCNLCEKEGTKYFEAILQIRSANPDVLDRCASQLQERVSGLRSRGLFINKVDRFDDGFDLYLTSNKLAQVIGREILDHYGGTIKVSPRLFSKNHQTSKDLYRVNVFVKLPEFDRGDYIVVNDRVHLVEKLGKKIKLVEMQGGGSIIADYDKLDYRLLRKQQAFVSKTYPYIEVINPHDYQSSMVRNKPKIALSIGQSVFVVIHKGIFVVD
jgi:nonsense-mediated mRNA decay protein 3